MSLLTRHECQLCRNTCRYRSLMKRPFCAVGSIGECNAILHLRRKRSHLIQKTDHIHCRAAFESACEKLDCDLVEMDGEADHVHLLVSYPLKLASEYW